MGEGKHLWSLIGGICEKKESFEKALSRRVGKEMGITIENVEFVSDSYYHAKLTDDNVNKIERSEGQLLDFFTLKEIDKLLMSPSTRQFITKLKELVQKTHIL